MNESIVLITKEVLAAYGISEAELARRIGVSQPSINRIVAGKQRPSYEIGRAIEQLHRERPDQIAAHGAPEGTVNWSQPA